MASHEQFFRHEATSAAAQREFGSPLRPMPVSWSVLAAGLFIVALSAILFLSLATFYRKETAVGVLSYRDGARHVYAPKAGVISEAHVKDGEHVEADTPLLSISTVMNIGAGTTADERQIGALDSHVAAIEERINALREANSAEKTLLERRLEGLHRQIDALRPVEDLVRRRLAIAQASMSSIEGASKGLFPSELLRQRNADHLEQQRRLLELQAQLVQIDTQIHETEASIAKLPSDLAQQIATLNAEIAQIDLQRAQISAQKGFLIKAPVAGRISNPQAIVGQSADPAIPLMTIVPEGHELEADLFVPSRSVGFIKPGQSVRLYFDAFPHERFGAGEAVVRSIASGVLRPQELQTSVKVEEPVYRVELDLTHADISAYGQSFPLRAGMSFTADIILERRSFISLVLDPLRASGDRLLATSQ